MCCVMLCYITCSYVMLCYITCYSLVWYYIFCCIMYLGIIICSVILRCYVFVLTQTMTQHYLLVNRLKLNLILEELLKLIIDICTVYPLKSVVSQILMYILKILYLLVTIIHVDLNWRVVSKR